MNIDYRNGIYFDFAIAKKNAGMLSIFIKYAEDNNVSREKLVHLLSKSVNEMGYPAELDSILKGYIGDQDDSIDEEWLTDVPLPGGQEELSLSNINDVVDVKTIGDVTLS